MAVVELSDDQPSPWVRLVLKGTGLEPKVIDQEDETEIPFQLVAKRFKSSSAASYEFIHDPLGYLIDAQGTEVIFEGVELTRDWTVTTHVVNHHRTLKARHLYALVSADDDEKTVGVQLIKLEA